VHGWVKLLKSDFDLVAEDKPNAVFLAHLLQTKTRKSF